MAKKGKKSGAKPQAKMTPERYIKERARKLPIGRCFVNNDWESEGLAQIIVTRNRTDGNFVMATYLVDIFCMGVKDCFCHPDFPQERLNELMRRMDDGNGFKEVPYVEVHNIIYGGIEFAEEAGIPPIKDFNLAKYVLEEDTDDIPLIEYEYGKDGKYFLVCGPNNRDKLFIEPLKKRLGDNFDYVYEGGMAESLDPQAMENFEKFNKIREKFPDEEFSYDYPQYPSELTIKNPFIAEEFAKPEHYYYMPEDVRDRILSLPADEAAQDISDIIMYEIGRTYKGIEDGSIHEDDNTIDLEPNGTLMHAIIFLSHIDSNAALNAILEVMKQSGEFADYHFGDIAPELIFQALYMAGKNDVDKIVEYIHEPGHATYLRSQALYALAMIAQNHPERREEIIGIFRDLMKSMVDRVPRRDACDGSFAGFLMSTLLDLNARELLPEVKELFDADCVDPTIAGDYDEVSKELDNSDSRFINKYEPESIEKQYSNLKSFEPEK